MWSCLSIVLVFDFLFYVIECHCLFVYWFECVGEGFDVLLMMFVQIVVHNCVLMGDVDNGLFIDCALFECAPDVVRLNWEV